MNKPRPHLRPLRILAIDELRAVTGGGETAPRPTGHRSTFASPTGRSATEATTSLVSNPPTFSK